MTEQANISAKLQDLSKQDRREQLTWELITEIRSYDPGLEPDISHEASDKCFETAEVLEMILEFVDMRTVLLAQRVNRHFRSLINGSPSLRWKLFFTSQSYKVQEKDWEDPPDTAIPNPLLFDEFRALLCPHHHGLMKIFQDMAPLRYERFSILSFQALFPTPHKRSIFLRPEASWRRMLLTQPGIRIMQIEECLTNRDGVTSISDTAWDARLRSVADLRKESNDVALLCPLRMGLLYDMIEAWLSKDVTGNCFGMYWYADLDEGRFAPAAGGPGNPRQIEFRRFQEMKARLSEALRNSQSPPIKNRMTLALHHAPKMAPALTFQEDGGMSNAADAMIHEIESLPDDNRARYRHRLSYSDILQVRAIARNGYWDGKYKSEAAGPTQLSTDHGLRPRMPYGGNTPYTSMHLNDHFTLGDAPVDEDYLNLT